MLQATRLLIVLTVSFSFIALPASILNVPIVHANTAPTENWYPSGPVTDNLAITFFTDETAEWTSLQAGGIDLTDWPLSPAIMQTFCANPAFYCTQPISAKEYFELQFHLGTNFWGCPMNFGNSACGKNIRQGIAHLIDKTIFTSTQANIAGVATPIDNPVPPSAGLPSPNSCSWDPLYAESGTACRVGAAGGTGYHLAAATGAVYPWQPALGSPDFCAAAGHFIAAGIATGKNAVTCVLTTISPAASSNTVNMFARSDSPPRQELGDGVTQELCALFTGAFTTGCTYVNETPGPITAFPGFTTSTVSVATNWNMYTAGFSGVLTFDNGLYFGYNSRFVSGIPSIKQPTGPCSPLSQPTASAQNYMYLCYNSFDNISTQMEFSPCLNAAGDPTSGQTTPTFSNCPSTSQLSSTSAGYQAADLFGQNAFTIPIYSGNNQYAYTSNWQRVVNNQAVGLLNYFATLDAYSTSPAIPGTIRQGFKQMTHSLNPYYSNTYWDFGAIQNIYDTVNTVNPEATSQLMDWMSVNSRLIPGNQSLGYTPPSGTVATYRFTLRGDIFWQDGRKVTAWDVAFSYLTLKAIGAYQASGLAPMVGVKVLNPQQIDVNLNAIGPFTQLYLTQPTIIPGRYWSSQCPAGIWDTDVTFGGIPDKCMTVDPIKTDPHYDPLAAGILVGSGPWVCRSSSGAVGIGCSSTGSQNPTAGGTYTFKRFGAGTTAGLAAPQNTYFRSNGNLALYIWTGNTGRQDSEDFTNFSVITGPNCYAKPIGTAGCTRWQQGIGAPNGNAMIGLTQVSEVQRFYQYNWVSPYDWSLSPPTGIGTYPPVLYEGLATLNPARLVGCIGTYPNAGYDC